MRNFVDNENSQCWECLILSTELSNYCPEMVSDTSRQVKRRFKSPTHLYAPPPPPTLLWATSQYLDIVIRRYRDDRDGGCGNFSFHYLCIGQNGGNIALTVFIHEEGGGRTKQQNLISEVENISVWRKIISTPNIRPLTDVAVTVSWFDYWSILMWYIDINWTHRQSRERLAAGRHVNTDLIISNISNISLLLNNNLQFLSSQRPEENI